jgi:hypothetical protein
VQVTTGKSPSTEAVPPPPFSRFWHCCEGVGQETVLAYLPIYKHRRANVSQGLNGIYLKKRVFALDL